MRNNAKGSKGFAGVIAVIVFILIIGLSKCGKSNKDESPKSEVVTESISETSSNDNNGTSSDSQENLEIIYADDENINLYINRFNSANPNEKITSSLAQKYYHHGKEHDDQVKYYIGDFEFVLTGGAYSKSIKIVIQGKPTNTNDEYKELFFKYAKGFDPQITDEKLENYWKQIMEDTTNRVKFDEFECDFDIYKDDKIELMVIEGKLE